jgi:hypothetical protein
MAPGLGSDRLGRHTKEEEDLKSTRPFRFLMKKGLEKGQDSVLFLTPINGDRYQFIFLNVQFRAGDHPAENCHRACSAVVSLALVQCKSAGGVVSLPCSFKALVLAVFYLAVSRVCHDEKLG